MTTPRMSFWSFLLVVSLAITCVTPAAADDPFSGSLRLGWRAVDVGGNENKYREDIDLEEGARLFELNLDYHPAVGENAFADRIELDVDNFGGDPFETLYFDMRRHGSYHFNYRRTKSAYFYEDIILPLDLSQPSLSDAGDFHHFDFDRVRDVASFEVQLSPRAQLDIGFERFTKKGESTTTLDIQRDEFELDRPVEESYDDFQIGFQYSWDKFTLVLEESFRQYDNGGELFLPGRSLGEDPADAAVLDFFFFEQPYSIDTHQHAVRLNARPTDRLLLRGSVLFQELELEADVSETSAGTTFQGQPTTTNLSGTGDIERDSELYEVDFSYRISDRFALVGGARSQSFDQDGAFTVNGETSRGVWEIENDILELGFETNLRPDLTLAFGLRNESRDVENAEAQGDALELPEEGESTDHEGYYLSLAWRPMKGLQLEAELEDSSYDDPFTLSSPTDRQRLRLRASYRTAKGLHLNGSYVNHEYENHTSGWETDRDQFTLRAGYHGESLSLSAGYSTSDIGRSVDQLVITRPGFGGGVTFLYPILYEAQTDFFDADLRYRANERLTVGGQVRWYDNEGSFALSRDDLRAYLEYVFDRGYLVHLAYRTVDYDEDAANFDDYDADITEFSVGYRW